MGKTLTPVVSQYTDIKLPPIYVLLDDGIRPDALMDETDAFTQLLVVLDDGGLGYADGAVVRKRFDDEGKRQPFRSLDLTALAEHAELGNVDTVVAEKLLGEGFVSRQEKPSWIRARVGYLEQFQVADDVHVVNGNVVEIFQKIENDVRVEILYGATDVSQIAADSEGLHLVPDVFQCLDDIELHLPIDSSDVDAGHVLGRHQGFVHQSENAQLLHNAKRYRPA